ncbi:UNVERIFIED_CONTAM: hypothetical protein HDU68_002825 [Siphonaria sp. JEL0065]|nr:hypothetical protein HDU68_002825 [Siphonaria sp. JEL0065]
MLVVNLALLTSLATAKNLGRKIYGHYAKGMSKQATECAFTYQIVQPETCQEVATQNAMSYNAFRDLNNKNPYIDCSDSRNQIWPPVVVCIASQVFQAENGQAFNATTMQKITLPGGDSSNKPIFNGFV